MGVPAFFSWILKHYPAAVVDSSQFPRNKDFYGLYIDANSLVHEFLNGELPTFGTLVECTFRRLDELIALVKPNMLIFIAFDGDAPRAKHGRREQNQQHKQATKTTVDWDTVLQGSWLKPGTSLMAALEYKLKEFVQQRLQTHPSWKKARVVISDSTIMGEGEQKILNHFRYESNVAGGARGLNCFYGSDADLIMLALASESSDRLFVLRHSCQSSSSIYSKDKFVDVSRLKRSLVQSVSPWCKDVQQVLSEHRIARDLVFTCFLLGNDFLPALTGLDVKAGGMDVLLRTYASFLKMSTQQQLISDNGRLNLPALQSFLRDLAGRLKGGATSTKGVGRTNVATEYVQGLHWLVDYYFHGICGGWAYYGAIAPRASEILAICATPCSFSLPSYNINTGSYIVEMCSRYSKLKKVDLATGKMREPVSYLGPQRLATLAH